MTQQPPAQPRFMWGRFIVAIIVTAGITAGIMALLTNIFERKQEAKNPYIRFIDVDESTTDPAVWGVNWPREYDSYLRTAVSTRTRFGGHGGSEALPEEKIERDPWLKRMFLGYAFAIDYRDRRGHAYMLHDQESTRRVGDKPQGGSCLHCHASIIPTYRRLGDGDVQKGFVMMSKMSYLEAHAELLKTPDGSDKLTPSMRQMLIGSDLRPDVLTDPHKAPQPQSTTQAALVSQNAAGRAHPVSCVDCHNPANMELRVTRPGFINGIKALMASRGKPDYDPNRDATRQEMRSYVCAQCHVEYYCATKMPLTFPWGNGLKAEDIEKFWDDTKFSDGSRFMDYKHAETGAELLKAQHPEFELFSQGIHARAGVSCADCHMPYERQGAMKVSDHWVRSPLLNIARACQPCHSVAEEELKARAETIQQRNFDLLQRSGHALVNMMDAIVAAKKAGVPQDQLAAALAMHRKAQWRIDFIAAENSMGFHAPQEAARVLAEAIDYARQGEIAAQKAMIEKK